jgi:catechol 2,3-dioxygenase-like lactoylglutathione lyase family enzyme
MRTLCLLAASAAALLAQTAPPNDAGVSLGHIHYVVTDVDATKKAWVDILGAEPSKAGTLELLKLPGIFIIVSKAAMPPADGMNSVVNHIGIEVKDYPGTKAKAAAAGLMWRELTPNIQAFLTMPEGATVEIMENKTLASPAAFHHIHESVVDGEAARAWYMKELGAGSGSRRNLPAAMFPGGEVDFLKARMPTETTKGKLLDHIGFEVKDLDALLKKLAADGVTINMPLRDMIKQIGLKIAFITDPNGTYIELTEGLNTK